jgi:hypothetical protein
MRTSAHRGHENTMIPKIIKTPLVKAVRVSIDFTKYFAVFVAALALPAVLFGADLIGKFTALVLMLVLLLVVGSYGKSVLF